MVGLPVDCSSFNHPDRRTIDFFNLLSLDPRNRYTLDTIRARIERLSILTRLGRIPKKFPDDIDFQKLSVLHEWLNHDCGARRWQAIAARGKYGWKSTWNFDVDGKNRWRPIPSYTRRFRPAPKGLKLLCSSRMREMRDSEVDEMEPNRPSTPSPPDGFVTNPFRFYDEEEPPLTPGGSFANPIEIPDDEEPCKAGYSEASPVEIPDDDPETSDDNFDDDSEISDDDSDDEEDCPHSRKHIDISLHHLESLGGSPYSIAIGVIRRQDESRWKRPRYVVVASIDTLGHVQFRVVQKRLDGSRILKADKSSSSTSMASVFSNGLLIEWFGLYCRSVAELKWFLLKWIVDGALPDKQIPPPGEETIRVDTKAWLSQARQGGLAPFKRRSVDSSTERPSKRRR